MQSPSFLHGYCETDYGDGEKDKGKELSIKSVSEIAHRKKFEHEQPIENVSKRTTLSGSRQTAVIAAEQAIESYTKKAVEKDAPGEDIMPILSQVPDAQDGAAKEKCLHSSSGSNEVSDKQEWNGGVRKLEQAFSPKTNPKNLTKLPSSLHVNPENVQEAALRKPDCEDLADVLCLSQPPSLSRAGGAGTAVQESGDDQEIGLPPPQKAINVACTTPSSMMRAKAGHYVSRSLLVDPDTEDVERHARAMTNGKGDWRGRFTHLLRDLSAPSKNRALVDDPLSMMALEQPTGKKVDMVALPNSLSGTPKKRKFGEFNVDAGSALRPNSGLPSSLSKQNGFGMSPKEHREELARKKRVKREALEKAKAEANALRRQVEEMEAGQSEAIAREEAEVSLKKSRC